jgi:hypothetical protein
MSRRVCLPLWMALPACTVAWASLAISKHRPALSLASLALDRLENENVLDDPFFQLALEETLVIIDTMMEESLAPEESDRHSHWRQLVHTCTKAVKVDQSSIPGAGLGLFASNQSLEKRQIVSIYPVHGIGIELEFGAGDDAIAMACLHPEDQTYFDSQQDRDGPNYRQHMLGNRPLGAYSGPLPPLVMDVNPNRPIRSGWMSHCVNDGSVVHENSEEGVLDYYQSSLDRQNCLQIPFGPLPLVATVTTRKIEANEELFTSYGSAYWLDDLLTGNEKAVPNTNQIQAYVKRSAKELLHAAQQAKIKYAPELVDLSSDWNGFGTRCLP